MKPFLRAPGKRWAGFSLVEASLAVGILSFGCLSLAPLLGEGLTSARQARVNEMTAQIARNVAAEARDGTLTAGTGYCDGEGATCAQTAACFRIDTAETILADNCTRLTIVVTAVDAPNRPASYAVVLPPP